MYEPIPINDAFAENERENNISGHASAPGHQVFFLRAWEKNFKKLVACTKPCFNTNIINL